MKRMFPIVVLGGSALLFAGCGKDAGPLETAYELTGEGGAVAEVTRSIPSIDKDPSKIVLKTATDKAVTLPWKSLVVAERGETVMEATPSKGSLVCRIVVEGKEVARVEGKPGEKVTCKAKVDE